MALTIDQLRGMTKELEAKLKEHRVQTTDELFEAALTPARRHELAAYAGVSDTAILELANRADLSRIMGIAGAYSDLLEEAGVDTVKELAARSPENLHIKLLEVNAQKTLTAQPPSLKMVQTWVSLAKRRRKFLQN